MIIYNDMGCKLNTVTDLIINMDFFFELNHCIDEKVLCIQPIQLKVHYIRILYCIQGIFCPVLVLPLSPSCEQTNLRLHEYHVSLYQIFALIIKLGEFQTLKNCLQKKKKEGENCTGRRKKPCI